MAGQTRISSATSLGWSTVSQCNDSLQYSQLVPLLLLPPAVCGLVGRTNSRAHVYTRGTGMVVLEATCTIRTSVIINICGDDGYLGRQNTQLLGYLCVEEREGNLGRWVMHEKAFVEKRKVVDTILY